MYGHGPGNGHQQVPRHSAPLNVLFLVAVHGHDGISEGDGGQDGAAQTLIVAHGVVLAEPGGIQEKIALA